MGRGSARQLDLAVVGREALLLKGWWRGTRAKLPLCGVLASGSWVGAGREQTWTGAEY
eukprot:COSAG02_NODE_1653_length_11488_cov_66.480815_9_plen_58_part_00